MGAPDPPVGKARRRFLLAGQLAERAASRAPIRPDPRPHVSLRSQRACADCEGWTCTLLCPAGVFRLQGTPTRVAVEDELCVECGACYLFCPCDNVDFRWPRPGHGVANRYG